VLETPLGEEETLMEGGTSFLLVTLEQIFLLPFLNPQ
jgi:hypothetical protein